MAPIEVNQQAGRARRWKRLLKIDDLSTSWAGDDSASGNVKRFSGSSRGRARVVKPRQDGIIGVGAGGIGDDQRGRSQSPAPNPGDVESDDDLLDDEPLSEESADELDDGNITDVDGDGDGVETDIDSPPGTPFPDISPTFTLSSPGAGATIVPLPSDTAIPAIPPSPTVSLVVDTTTSPVSATAITLTPIVETATETSSIASSILVSTVPLPEITSQPQKGVVQDGPPPAFTVPLPAIDDTLTSSTTPDTVTRTLTTVPFASATPDIAEESDYEGPDNDDDFRDAIRQGPPPPGRPSGLSQSSEHALIAVGSIGAFILFCFIAWVVYRTMKRYKGGSRFVDSFGWKRKDPSNGIFGMPGEPPPVYEKLDGHISQSQGFYSPGKTFSGQPGNMVQSEAWGSQQGTLRNTTNGEGTLANIVAGYHSGSGTLQNTGTNFTLGVRIADDQLGLANQPSDPYNAPKQQPVYRISQISSLSSGFGDGDIVIAQPVVPQPLTAPPPVVTQPPKGASDSEPERYDKRETVYTQNSEDRPARFRSIHSWVNQQTGRVQRASLRARERGEVPVMPAIPGELNVTQQTAYR